MPTPLYDNTIQVLTEYELNSVASESMFRNNFEFQHHTRSWLLVYSPLPKNKRFPLPVCPRSSDPSHIVIYYKKWVTTSWTYSSISRVFLQASYTYIFEFLNWRFQTIIYIYLLIYEELRIRVESLNYAYKVIVSLATVSKPRCSCIDVYFLCQTKSLVKFHMHFNVNNYEYAMIIN